jgi:hypothetical protein
VSSAQGGELEKATTNNQHADQASPDPPVAHITTQNKTRETSSLFFKIQHEAEISMKRCREA